MTTNNGGTTTQEQTQQGQQQQGQQPNQQQQQPNNPPANNGESALVQQLRQEIETLKLDNMTNATALRTLMLRIVPEADRGAVEAVINGMQKESDLDVREAKLQEEAKQIYAQRTALQNQQYGVTYEALMACETADDMDKLVLTAERDWYKDPKNAQTGNQLPNPGNITSDKGTGGGGDTLPPKIEGKGIDAVTKHIGQVFAKSNGQ